MSRATVSYTNPSGPHVTEAQRLLTEISSKTGNAAINPRGVDGSYGPNTRNAVIAFQNYYNANNTQKISVDGVVGPNTWAALDKTISALSMMPATSPVKVTGPVTQPNTTISTTAKTVPSTSGFSVSSITGKFNALPTTVKIAVPLAVVGLIALLVLPKGKKA
jgi:peptidoglycan hydrolase-like protein with peptidoglycan-binding domain